MEEDKRLTVVPPNEEAEEDDLLPDVWVQQQLMPSAWAQQLTPRNLPIPVPDFLREQGWRPDTAELKKPTPKDYRRVARNKEGLILYRYAPIAFFIKRANDVWGAGNWGYEIIREEAGVPEKGGNFEYTVALQFVAPGLFRPIIGIGSSTFYANNPQESTAKTRNAALTSALKASLKQLGIGRDVEEDDPEVQKIVEGRLMAIGAVYKRLVDGGKQDVAKAVIRRHAPSALLDSGELLTAAIDFEKLEPIQRELQNLVISGAAKAVEVREASK